jgi:hypothetical protein
MLESKRGSSARTPPRQQWQRRAVFRSSGRSERGAKAHQQNLGVVVLLRVVARSALGPYPLPKSKRRGLAQEATPAAGRPKQRLATRSGCSLSWRLGVFASASLMSASRDRRAQRQNSATKASTAPPQTPPRPAARHRRRHPRAPAPSPGRTRRRWRAAARARSLPPCAALAGSLGCATAAPRCSLHRARASPPHSAPRRCWRTARGAWSRRWARATRGAAPRRARCRRPRQPLRLQSSRRRRRQRGSGCRPAWRRQCGRTAHPRTHRPAPARRPVDGTKARRQTREECVRGPVIAATAARV